MIKFDVKKYLRMDEVSISPSYAFDYVSDT
jgi:hypothetical protein